MDLTPEQIRAIGAKNIRHARRLFALAEAQAKRIDEGLVRIHRGLSTARLRWKPHMAEIIPEGRAGNVEVYHFDLSPQKCGLDNVRAALNGNYHAAVVPGRYCGLRVDGRTMMSDVPMEWRTNLDFISRARGRVLIAGLGIGLIVKAISAHVDVRSVMVIEQNAHVIERVWPWLFASIKKRALGIPFQIVHKDIFCYEPLGTFDTIYFDIWPTISSDNLVQMNRLENMFRPYLRDNGWMACWMKRGCERHKR